MMTPKKFKELVTSYEGHYYKDEASHRAWWDAYDREGHRNMYILFGRLIELIRADDPTILILIGNQIHWNPKPRRPKAPAPPARIARGGRATRASRSTAE